MELTLAWQRTTGAARGYQGHQFNMEPITLPLPPREVSKAQVMTRGGAFGSSRSDDFDWPRYGFDWSRCATSRVRAFECKVMVGAWWGQRARTPARAPCSSWRCRSRATLPLPPREVSKAQVMTRRGAFGASRSDGFDWSRYGFDWSRCATSRVRAFACKVMVGAWWGQRARAPARAPCSSLGARRLTLDLALLRRHFLRA